MAGLARSRGDKVVDGIIMAILILVALICLYPIWFTVIASVSNPTYISNGQVILWPKGFNLDAYRRLLDNRQIWIGYRNTIFYTVVGTCFDLAVTLPCAYALSRYKLPGRRWLMLLFLFAMYFSGGIIPNYLLYNQLGMINTIWVLLLPGTLNVYNMIIARSFFESSIPEPVFESAKIDGASYTRFFVQFALPLSKAMIAVISLLYALGHWNAYLGPRMYLQSPNLQTLQVIIRDITARLDTSLVEDMSSEELVRQVQEKQLMKYAVVIVSIIPMMMAYPFIQRYFVGGIMIGAVKG